MREFSKVMQTLDYVSGLHSCLEFSQLSSCLDEAMYCKHGSALLLASMALEIVIKRSLVIQHGISDLSHTYADGDMAAILVLQNSKTAAMFVYQANPVEVQVFCNHFLLFQ